LAFVQITICSISFLLCKNTIIFLINLIIHVFFISLQKNTAMNKKVCILAGARPNFVKVSPLVRAISKRSDAECLLVYAGSKDDPTLEPSLFEDLQIAPPQYYLGVSSTSLNEITSQVMAAFDRFLDEHSVDVVIVVDDLASTMAAAIVTKKRAIRLAHLVAGTRSFNINMPKEINRLVIDALSDYLFTAGVRSTGIATREQSESSQTYMVGNILMDTLRFNYDRLRKPALDIEDGQYIVFTLNRKALIADKGNLTLMLKATIEAAGNTPIIAPLRSEAAKVVSDLLPDVSIFSLVNPLGYLEFGWLTAHAKGVITDSGNVAEEATFNSVPCITLNNYTEHQETVNVGSNVLVGEDAEKLRDAVAKMVTGEWKKCALPDRWDGRTADRILQILLS
jgi:UDP-N-acetylglucosamine 2-epimerase (non-hydrolysing)